MSDGAWLRRAQGLVQIGELSASTCDTDRVAGGLHNLLVAPPIARRQYLQVLDGAECHARIPQPPGDLRKLAQRVV